jgi:hypothetical protein
LIDPALPMIATAALLLHHASKHDRLTSKMPVTLRALSRSQQWEC